MLSTIITASNQIGESMKKQNALKQGKKPKPGRGSYKDTSRDEDPEVE